MPRFSANISMLFSDRPLLRRFEDARAAGFRAVEIQFPYEAPAAKLDTARRNAGVDVALINVPVGDYMKGGPGLAAMPGREDDFRAALDQAMEYAAVLKPRCMNVLGGAPPADLPREKCMETLARNLQHAAETMAAAGIVTTVEAINTRDRPEVFLSSTADAMAAIDWAGHANLTLQYDLYHMQVVEGDLAATLENHIGRIGHIQFADVPGRHEPGTGEINFDFLFETIDALEYEGWVGAEYVPSAVTEETLGWFQPYRRKQRRRRARTRDAA